MAAALLYYCNSKKTSACREGATGYSSIAGAAAKAECGGGWLRHCMRGGTGIGRTTTALSLQVRAAAAMLASASSFESPTTPQVCSMCLLRPCSLMNSYKRQGSACSAGTCRVPAGLSPRGTPCTPLHPRAAPPTASARPQLQGYAFILQGSSGLAVTDNTAAVA